MVHFKECSKFIFDFLVLGCFFFSEGLRVVEPIYKQSVWGLFGKG